MLYYNHVRTILCAPITQHAHAGITHFDRTIAPATIMEMDAWRINGSQALWHCGSEIKSETQLNSGVDPAVKSAFSSKVDPVGFPCCFM